MYKLDKTKAKPTTIADLEDDKLFPDSTSLYQRLCEAWYLTCMAYGIDPENPPKMRKELRAIRYTDGTEKIFYEEDAE